MQRRYINAALGSGSLIGLLLWIAGLVGWVLDQIGRVQTARDVYDSLGPVTVAGVTFNWPVLYFWLFILSTSFLIAVNWPYIRAWYRRRTEPKIWNAPAAWAINYLVFGARVKETFKYGTRLNEAAEMLFDYASNGQIQIAGKAPKSGLLVRIPRKTWKQAILSFQTVDDYGTGTKRVSEASLLDKNKRENVLYRGLMIVESDIKRIFPT